jgi:hypothetical protein
VRRKCALPFPERASGSVFSPHPSSERARRCACGLVSREHHIGQLITAIFALFTTFAMPIAPAQDRTFSVFAAASMSDLIPS